MGTRADFYVGKGAEAEWIGSVAYDGYRDCISDVVLNAHSEMDYRAAVETMFASRDDATRPAQGWPWPWDDSATSDCSYWYFDGRVWDARCRDDDENVFVPCDEPEPEWGGETETELLDAWLKEREPILFPDMSARKNVTFGPRSGVLILRG